MENSSATNQPTPDQAPRGRNLTVVSERQPSPPPPSNGAAGAAALAAKEAELQAALASLRALFRALGSRALVIIAALGACAAFGWALYEPSGWKVAGACLFTAMVFWPALWIDRMRPS